MTITNSAAEPAEALLDLKKQEDIVSILYQENFNSNPQRTRNNINNNNNNNNSNNSNQYANLVSSFHYKQSTIYNETEEINLNDNNSNNDKNNENKTNITEKPNGQHFYENIIEIVANLNQKNSYEEAKNEEEEENIVLTERNLSMLNNNRSKVQSSVFNNKSSNLNKNPNENFDLAENFNINKLEYKNDVEIRLDSQKNIMSILNDLPVNQNKQNDINNLDYKFSSIEDENHCNNDNQIYKKTNAFKRPVYVDYDGIYTILAHLLFIKFR